MSQRIQPKTPKTIKLINQGTFGCVFRPGLKCGTNTIDSNKFIAKVQVDADEVNRETEIGALIKKIPKYQYRFAPIIETCPINISTIGNTEINKCEVIMNTMQKKTNPKFVSNKIQYVGKKTLGDYLDHLLISNHTTHSKSIDNYFKKIIDIHIYLLQSLQLLANNNIIHYDLKENNIMYDESNDVPVIIDFGLSFQIDKLTEANYRDAFYTLYAQYTCWSIEITLICYIIERIYKKKLETLKSPIKKPALEEMKKQVQIYISENEALKNHISDKEKDLFKLKINRYVNSFHEKTWKQLIDALISTYKSWDNYSMSVIIIREISHTGIIDEQKTAFLQDYLNIIKTVILSPPGQRQDTSITMAAIKNIFIKVNKIDYNTFKKGLRVNTIDQIRQRRAENTLSQLKQDNELKKRRVNP